MAADPLAPLVALPGVAAAADRARSAVDRLLTHQAMRRHAVEVTAEAGLRSARASAALEGVDVGLEDLRAGTVGDPVVHGALRVAGELRPLADAVERAPLQAFARMHLLACAGMVPDALLGRPRVTDGDPVEDPLGLGAAPPATTVGDRLALLSRVLTTPTSAPGVVVAAVAHGELLAVRPFALGNGLVARAAARAVMLARGVDPRAASAPDVGYALDRGAYAAAARAYAGGDVAPWLVFCAEAVEHGAVEGVAIGEALLRAQT